MGPGITETWIPTQALPLASVYDIHMGSPGLSFLICIIGTGLMGLLERLPETARKAPRIGWAQAQPWVGALSLLLGKPGRSSTPAGRWWGSSWDLKSLGTTQLIRERLRIWTQSISFLGSEQSPCTAMEGKAQRKWGGADELRNRKRINGKWILQGKPCLHLSHLILYLFLLISLRGNGDLEVTWWTLPGT